MEVSESSLSDAYPSAYPDATNERHLITEYIRLWGGSGSIALFDPACKIFRAPPINGMIGYRVEFGCAVVFGDPICPSEEIEPLTYAFHKFCKEQRWKIVYTVVSEPFIRWAIKKNVCGALVEFGEELILDPHLDPKIGPTGRKLRNKISRALHAHVSVKEYLPYDEKLEQAIENAALSWLQGRQGLQIYLSHVHLFAEKNGKRWFYAKQGENIIGVLLLNRFEARRGWLFNLLMTIPNAPPGTSELLVSTALDFLRKEGCSFATFGAVPGEELGEIVGLNMFSMWLGRKLFKIAKKAFNLNTRKIYWKKFRPKAERSYLLFSRTHIGIREIIGVMRALNVSL